MLGGNSTLMTHVLPFIYGPQMGDERLLQQYPGECLFHGRDVRDHQVCRLLYVVPLLKPSGERWWRPIGDRNGAREFQGLLYARASSMVEDASQKRALKDNAVGPRMHRSNSSRKTSWWEPATRLYQPARPS